MQNNIELISVDILEKYSGLSTQLIRMGKSLALSSGWHYALDWTWVASIIGEISGKTILDAGAGIGLMQWYFASKGANVISVDRSDRTCIPFHLLNRFNVTGYRPEDSPLTIKEILNITNGKARLSSRISAIIRGIVGKTMMSGAKRIQKGSVRFLNGDLQRLSEIPDGGVEIVVSISALEHNEQISDIKIIIQELERVLVPGGMMLITLPASADKDWFFYPAYSWCFTESTLQDLFNFDKATSSNFHQYGIIFEKLINSEALKKSMSLRYYFQPKSGMPWGRWDPKYLPVGIIKVKQVQNRQ